jgi:hypothetical protein
VKKPTNLLPNRSPPSRHPEENNEDFARMAGHERG